MRAGQLIESSLGQGLAIHSQVFQQIAIVAISSYQRVPRIYGVIDARAEIREPARRQNHLTNLYGIKGRIQNCGPDQLVIVGFVAIELQEKGSLSFLHWPAEAAAKLANLERRTLA